jgi:hypothetical protein
VQKEENDTYPLLTLTRNNTYQASILKDSWNSKYSTEWLIDDQAFLPSYVLAPPTPPPPPPLPSASRLSFSSSYVSPVEITDGRGGEGVGRSQIIRRRDRLVLDLYKSFNTLCCTYNPVLPLCCIYAYILFIVQRENKGQGTNLACFGLGGPAQEGSVSTARHPGGPGHPPCDQVRETDWIVVQGAAVCTEWRCSAVSASHTELH